MKKALLAAGLCFLTALGFAQRSQEVNLYIGRNVAPSAKIGLTINTKNVRAVPLSIYQVSPTALISLTESGKMPPVPTKKPFRQMTVDVTQSRKAYPAPADTYYQRRVNLPNLPPATYLIVAPGTGGNRVALANVTNLAVTIKSSPFRSLAWVTDFRSGETVANAKVTWIDLKSRKETGRATTNRDGIGVSVAPQPTQPQAVVVQRGSDSAVLFSSSSSREGQVVDHFWTDRPLYRPGQSVNYRLTLRRVKGIEYVPVGGATVRVELYDPIGTFLDRREVKSTPSGLVTGEFVLPSEAVLGTYAVHVIGTGFTAYQSFNVAEFRKPEFKVAITAREKRAFSGEKVQFSVASEYFFGGKVPGANVEFTAVFSGGSRFRDDAFGDDGNRYSSDVYVPSQILARGTIKADKAGVAVIEVEVPKGAPNGQISVQTTVTDGSRRQISAQANMPSFASERLVRATPALSYVPSGRLFPVDVVLTDLDGKGVAGTVTLALNLQIWNSAKREYETKTVSTSNVSVPASGRARVEIPAKTGPELTLVATSKDGQGRLAVSRATVWVADPNYNPPAAEKTPELSVKAEKDKIKLGDSLRAFIRTNQGKRLPILVTLEGYDLFAYAVQRGSQAQSWTLNRAMSPNVEIKVCQWAKGTLISGGQEIQVSDPSRTIQVGLTPIKTELAPGDRSQWRVTTRDSAGKPVAAELGISVVDSALLALQSDPTADIFRTLWGWRESQVGTFSSAPEEQEGGAFQDNGRLSMSAPAAETGAAKPKDAPVRKRFEDTAYWNPSILTDAQGEVTVDFELPGNLTTWQATARGLSGTNAAGTATGSQLASRPLTLRLATPRLMVQGDRLNVIATVTNRTDRDERVTVRMNGQANPLVVPAKGDARLEFPIPADQLGTQTFLGELINEAGTREDALQVTVPLLPDAVEFRSVKSGVYQGETKLTADVPADRIPGIGKTVLTFFAGRQGVLEELERRITNEWRYGALVAVAQLQVARSQPTSYRVIVEPLSSLGRSFTGSGWGRWAGAMEDPEVNARVLSVFAGWKPVNDQPVPLLESARTAAAESYRRTAFWEVRALLALALVQDNVQAGTPLVLEVNQHADELSPTARLALAEALFRAGRVDDARAQYKVCRDLVSRGSGTSYLPVGEGIGWIGGVVEANARLIRVGLMLGEDFTLLSEIADWMGERATGWCDTTAAAEASVALRALEAKNPSARSVKALTVKVGGEVIPVRYLGDGAAAVAEWPLSQGEAATVTVAAEGGKPRFRLDTRYYRRVSDEEGGRLRTLFRWEIQNEAGAWEEVSRPIRPNEPVRCTAVVWGDAITDAVRVKMPIPAGFEFIEFGEVGSGRSEVRDGAVNYFTELRDGLPESFRFFLRGETDGQITVLPAEAEVIRRPEQRGYSRGMKVTLVGRP